MRLIDGLSNLVTPGVNPQDVVCSIRPERNVSLVDRNSRALLPRLGCARTLRRGTPPQLRRIVGRRAAAKEISTAPHELRAAASWLHQQMHMWHFPYTLFLCFGNE